MADQYIWIARWEAFQHYEPRRDRGPEWIKDYPAQLKDERYLALTDRQRALLRDIRDVFAMMRGRLPDDSRMITRQRCSQTRRGDLEALNHAGLIEFISREVLEQRLEEFYTSRARARGREKERGTYVPLSKEEERSRERANANGSLSSVETPTHDKPVVCPECEIGGGHHLADCSLAEPLGDVAQLGKDPLKPL